MDFATPRERLRGLMSGGECIHPVSVFDPISARIAEDLGFEVGMFASSIASVTVLGAPDLAVLTLTEFAEQLRRICRATGLSLIADADHGFGNALSVMRTVEELETAGVSALTIEDTVLPRIFGAEGNDGPMLSDAEMEAQEGLYLPTRGEDALLSLEEGVGKMRASLAARRDSRLVIAARTSALRITGLEDTIHRAKAYEQAGVDALFLAGVASKTELEAVRASVSIPLMLGGNAGELADKDYLESVGVTFALQGHLPLLAAVKAVHDTLTALRDGVPPTDLGPRLATAEQMVQLTRQADYMRWTEDFLT